MKRYVRTQEEANIILTDFHTRLEYLIMDYLLWKVSPEQVNVYFGWGNDCQIAEILRELEKEEEELEKEERKLQE